MVRTVLEPEVRRTEILNIALELFNEKGYEQTGISDIVKKANVAQGTFYYYFKSKDDILNAIIEKWTTELEKMLGQLVQSKVDATQKFFGFAYQINKISVKLQGTVNYVHEKKNELFHLRLMRRSKLAVTPFLEKIIQQGVEEGTFHTQYPKEAAMAFLAISDFLGHELGSIQEEANKRLMNAIMDFTERILGIKNGVLLETYESRKENLQKQTQNSGKESG